jgi:hypothetical protein
VNRAGLPAGSRKKLLARARLAAATGARFEELVSPRGAFFFGGVMASVAKRVNPPPI